MMIQRRDNSPRLVSPLPSLLDASIDESSTAGTDKASEQFWRNTPQPAAVDTVTRPNRHLGQMDLRLLLSMSLWLSAAAFSSAPPPPNTDPISGYWDCCKPACSAGDSPQHETFQTCDAIGDSPGVDHLGQSVCHADISTMKHLCPSAQGDLRYSVECLMRVPEIHLNELYAYASYTEPKGASTKHQLCGACRLLTLQTSENSTDSTVHYAHIKYVNSKPYPSEPGSHSMTGYRLLVPGAGMGDYTSGCACTFPGMYNASICGSNGTADSSNCKRFGGMQTPTGCEVSSPTPPSTLLCLPVTCLSVPHLPLTYSLFLLAAMLAMLVTSLLVPGSGQRAGSQSL